MGSKISCEASFVESKYQAFGMATMVLPSFFALPAVNGLAFLTLITVD
jgi:hypothetical protein